MTNIYRVRRLLQNGFNVSRCHHARILAYHSISTVAADPWTVSPTQLDAQLKILHHGGFQVCSLDQLVERLQHNEDVSKLVCLTFDDAFVDFKEIALPILSAWDAHATLFVPVGKVGSASHWSQYAPMRPLMNWDELETVLQAGVTLGSHGLDHLRLPNVCSEVLQAEVEESRDILRQRLGIEAQHFAYPYGASQQREQIAAQQAGYHSAVLFGGLWGNAPHTPRWALTREPMMATQSEKEFLAILHGRRDWQALWHALRAQLSS